MTQIYLRHRPDTVNQELHRFSCARQREGLACHSNLSRLFWCTEEITGCSSSSHLSGRLLPPPSLRPVVDDPSIIKRRRRDLRWKGLRIGDIAFATDRPVDYRETRMLQNRVAARVYLRNKGQKNCRRASRESGRSVQQRPAFASGELSDRAFSQFFPGRDPPLGPATLTVSRARARRVASIRRSGSC
jgi:hypothetical protein